MDHRWTGILKAAVNPNRGPPFFKVAASLLLSPSSSATTPLTVPALNAFFFNGDHVEGTGNRVIERLSDLQNIARLLVSKLGGGAVNAWVVDASTFNGPFAVYKELVPSVNSRGEPKRYDPDGFPASSSIVSILSDCIQQIENQILGIQSEPKAPAMDFPAYPSTSLPKTVILGFSKGGIVVNQLITELAHQNPSSVGRQISSSGGFQDHICPISVDSLLSSISEFHYVDVGLNCDGAYLIDLNAIKKIADCLFHNNASIRFAFHGSPRQWCDCNRPWIGKEKDVMRKLLEHEGLRCDGKLQVTERFYFGNSSPNLQMHFEIIECLDVG